MSCLERQHQELHTDPRSEREAGDPAASGLRIDRLRPIERGRRIRELALPMVERALAASDTAEVEAQYREVPMHESVVELIDDLMVHRAAELRMRMQHDADGGVLLPCRMIPALDPPGWAGKDDLGHL